MRYYVLKQQYYFADYEESFSSICKKNHLLQLIPYINRLLSALIGHSPCHLKVATLAALQELLRLDPDTNHTETKPLITEFMPYASLDKSRILIISLFHGAKALQKSPEFWYFRVGENLSAYPWGFIVTNNTSCRKLSTKVLSKAAG